MSAPDLSALRQHADVLTDLVALVIRDEPMEEWKNSVAALVFEIESLTPAQAGSLLFVAVLNLATLTREQIEAGR